MNNNMNNNNMKNNNMKNNNMNNNYINNNMNNNYLNNNMNYNMNNMNYNMNNMNYNMNYNMNNMNYSNNNYMNRNNILKNLSLQTMPDMRHNNMNMNFNMNTNQYNYNNNNGFNNNNNRNYQFNNQSSNSNNIQMINQNTYFRKNFMNNNNYNNGNLINYNSNNNNLNNNNTNFNQINAKTTIDKSSNDNYIELNFMVRTRGLSNVGATCYMNATLQCFYHVKPLSENLINDDKIDSGMKLTKCYKDLVEELTGIKNHNKKKFKIDLEYCNEDKNSKDYVEPKRFKDLISKENSLFKVVKANDSKDLIIFLLEGMDNELTKRNNNSSKKENFFGKCENDLRDEQFKRTHNSIFAELFYGFQKTSMKCLSCNFVDENYSIFNFLIFPLEKIYNSLNQDITNNNNIKYNNYMINNYVFRGNPYNYNNQINFPTTIIPSKKNVFKQWQKIKIR